MKKVAGILLAMSFYLNGYSLTWIQGTYTGNGVDNHAITGLGFQPDLLIIKGAAGTAAFMRTTSMAVNNSKQMDVSGAFSTTAIKTFTASGFTLGTSSGVNTNAAVYYFVAFDAGTDLVVSTYPGNGAINKSITGLGFSPDLLIIFSDNATTNASPNYLNSAMPDDKTSRFGNSGLWGFNIKSLDADGFTVGSNNNANSETYYYAAFKPNTAIKSGSYTSAAADKTVTTTGMTPRFVMVATESGVATSPVMKMGVMPTTTSAVYDNTAVSTSDIIGIAAGSFTVKNGSANANASGYPNYYTAFGAGGQLPIELEDFNVTCKDGAAKISWVTASETNNDYFTIDRTVDGENFEVVGTVAGAGNSSQSRYYSLTDDTIFSEPVYYRLKQTDYDGKYKYFNLVTFENCRLISGLEVNLYPNPIENEIDYQFELEDSAHLTIEIFDLLGKRVYYKQMDCNKGDQLLRLDLSNISKGIYIFKINDGIHQTSKRVTKQ